MIEEGSLEEIKELGIEEEATPKIINLTIKN